MTESGRTRTVELVAHVAAVVDAVAMGLLADAFPVQAEEGA